MRILFIFCGLFPFISCVNHSMDSIDFLIGTWQIESRDQYETWAKDRNNALIGYSYEVRENQEIILETLAIKMIDNQMVYEATVPDQNEGQSIHFTLNPDLGSCFSFENIHHDFPKKIQYHKLSDNEIKIIVLGEEGKGFSYKLIRQVKE